MSGNLSVTLLNSTMLLVHILYDKNFVCYLAGVSSRPPGSKPKVIPQLADSTGSCMLICSGVTTERLATGNRTTLTLGLTRGNLSQVSCMVNGGDRIYLNLVPIVTIAPTAVPAVTSILIGKFEDGEKTPPPPPLLLLLLLCCVPLFVGAVLCWRRRLLLRSERRQP